LKRISSATGIRVERDTDVEATSRGVAMLQLVATGKFSLEDLARVEREREAFSEKGTTALEEEYEKWKKTTALLRNSKGSYLAE
jgi:glycerol kinase